MDEMTTVLVFKTDITTVFIADCVEHKLRLICPQSKINFDMEDCDRILRVEPGSKLTTEKIIKTVMELNHSIEELE